MNIFDMLLGLAGKAAISVERVNEYYEIITLFGYCRTEITISVRNLELESRD